MRFFLYVCGGAVIFWLLVGLVWILLTRLVGTGGTHG